VTTESAVKQSPLRAFWNAAGRDTATYFVAEGFAKGGIYILFVWLATMLSVEGFGLLNVYVSLLTMVGAVIGLGLSEGLVRFHFDAADFRGVVGGAIALPVVFAIAVVALLYPIRSASAGFLNVPEQLLITALVVAPLLALRQSWLGILRARGEAGRYLLLRFVEPLLFLAAVAFLLATAATITYSGTVTAYSLAVAGTCLIGLVAVGMSTGMRWHTHTVRRLVAFSVPLVPHALAMAGLTAFDQLILQQLLGPEVTGTYAYAYRFAMVMALVVFALGAAWGPFVLRRLQAGQRESITPLARTTFHILILLAVILAWTVPFAAGIVGGDQYTAALSLIPLVVFAYLCMGTYSLAAVFLYSRDRSTTLAAASMTAFALNVLLNYLAIPRWGAAGAAVTTIISYVVLSTIVWSALGSDRHTLPWQHYALPTAAAAPLVLGAALYFR
jgi:O-antigen/teichoic acid export membrane protein